METLTAGIIGCGIRSFFVVREIKRHHGDVTLTAVVEPDRKQYMRFCRMNGIGKIKHYVSVKDFFRYAKPDMTFIMSPDFLHETHAVEAFRHNTAVFLEKPMAINADSARNILLAAHQFGAKLYVGHNMRHYKLLLEMKKIIDSGVIGKVQSCWALHHIPYGGDAYFKDWHSEKNNVNGLLLQKGVHDIDIIHWLCGSHTVSTSAMGKLSVYNRAPKRRGPVEFIGDRTSSNNWPPLSNAGMSPTIDVEDLNMMIMTLENGVIASYQQCHYTPDNLRKYVVFGDAGRIENYGLTGNGCEIRIFDRRNNKLPDEAAGIVCRRDIPCENHGGSDPELFDEFIGCCREGKTPSISPAEAYYAVAAADAATQSIREGGVLKKISPLDVEI